MRRLSGLVLLALLGGCIDLGFTKQRFERFEVGTFVADCAGSNCLDAYDDMVVANCRAGQRVEATFAGYKLKVCPTTEPFLKSVDPGAKSGFKLTHTTGERSGRSVGIGIGDPH
ncbi:MAG TPA: hypothetical protein VI670_19585 [Thermoanaerobaculia bacterium]|jgi:hypothetical protein